MVSSSSRALRWLPSRSLAAATKTLVSTRITSCQTLEVVVDPLRQIGLGVNRASETQTPTAADRLGAPLVALGAPLVGANRHMETPARSDTVTAKLGQQLLVVVGDGEVPLFSCAHDPQAYRLVARAPLPPGQLRASEPAKTARR